MNLQPSINRIRTLFSRFITEVESNKALGLTDLNKLSENVLIPLFTEIYGFRNLERLEKYHENHPAIDLGDKKAKVAIQVTATNTSPKFYKTLKGFVKYKLYNQYDRLIIYVISRKKERYQGKGYESILSGTDFKFDKDKDIQDWRNLLHEIRNFQLERARRVEKILEDNFGEFQSPFPKQLGEIQTEIGTFNRLEEFPPKTPLLVPAPLLSSTLENFVGRDDILKKLTAAMKISRILVLSGLPGIGKSMLMNRLSQEFDKEAVFQHNFLEGLASLNDLLLRLAAFLDNQSDSQHLLSTIVQAQISRQQIQGAIDLLVNHLNKSEYFLFFDSIENIENNKAIFSFFELLKNHLKNGNVFIAGQVIPKFYTVLDESRQIVNSFELTGFSKPEIKKLLDARGVKLDDDVVDILSYRFNGLPIAIELACTLSLDLDSDEELQTLLNKIEAQTIGYLFDKIYERLEPVERSLLKTASLFHLSFSAERLIDVHQKLASTREEGTYRIRKLTQRSLLQEVTPDTFIIHEVIRNLILAYSEGLDEKRVKVAQYLTSKIPGDLRTDTEAFILFYHAKAFDAAAEIAVSITEAELIPYYPDLAETILCSLDEECISTKEWVWVIGSKGMLEHYWRRHEEAERYYSDMLTLSQTLKIDEASAIAFQRLGIIMYERKMYERAENYYLESLKFKKKSGDQGGQAQIYNQLGILYCDQGRLKDAEVIIAKGLEIHDQLDSLESEKLALYGSLSLLHAYSHQWTEALQCGKKVCKIAKEMNWLHRLGQSIVNLGNFEIEQDHHDTAKQHYSEALKIGEEYDLWQVTELALNGLIYQSAKLGDHEEGISFVQRAIQIQEMLGNKARLSVLYFEAGIFYFRLGNYPEMVRHYEMGLNIFEFTEDEEQINRYLNNTYLILLEVPSESLPLLNTIKKLKNRLLEFDVSYCLAKVYQTLGLIYTEAFGKNRIGFSCLNKAYQLFEQISRWREGVNSLLHLGRAYGSSHYYDDALTTFSKAINRLQQLDFPALLTEAYFHRGFCFMNMERWDKAEKDYTEALKLSDEFEAPQFYRELQSKLGGVYHRQGRHEEAAKILEEALSNCRKEEGAEEGICARIDILSELGTVYQASTKKKKALDSFNEALTLSQRHHFKKLEVTSFIDLGNYHLDENQLEQAKECFEKALELARIIEDKYLEEGSMLSLAYAHFDLGTVKDVWTDFEKMAQQADLLQHYENLIQFLIFAGQVSFEEGKLDDAVKMFEQAVMLALIVGDENLPKRKSASDYAVIVNEVVKVIREFSRIIEKALNTHKQTDAQEFHKRLYNQLQQQGYWKIIQPSIESLFSAIGDYLKTEQDVPMTTYILSKLNLGVNQ